MSRQILFAVAFTLLCSAPSKGDDDMASTFFAPTYIGSEVAQESALPIKFVSARSIGMDCELNSTCEEYADSVCDSNGLACDSGLSGAEDKQSVSCIDWIIPRSNLPLPLMKELAEERDITLPLPLGTSVIWTELDRFVAVSDVRLGFGNTAPVSVERVDVPTTEFHVSSQMARLDLWVLPFINIYGLAGVTRTQGNVDVTVNRFPFPFSPPVNINVPVALEGPTGGGGITSVVGSKKWFASLDINKTWTDYSKFESSLTALVVTPRVGLVLDRPFIKGEIHTGAMWQDTAQTVKFTIDHPILGNGLDVEADQYEPKKWNYLVGGLVALDERVHLIVEGGTGGRSYVLAGVIVRY